MKTMKIEDTMKGFWTKAALFFNKYLKDVLETYAPLIEIIQDEVITGKKTVAIRIDSEYDGTDGKKRVRLGFYTLKTDTLADVPVYVAEFDIPTQ